MTNCIFCKIIKGEIPSYKVYEDEEVLAFLDVNPVTQGHTLVIPKEHYKDIFDIPEKKLKKIISVAKKIAENYVKIFNTDSVNLLNASGKAAQQSVFHFHMHIVPRTEDDGLDLWFHGENEKKEKVELVHEKIKNLFS